MPTSNSYNYTTTRDQIITEAFRKIGRLGDYETLDTERLNAGIAALNPMIKTFAAKGMPLWAITEQYIAFSNWSSSATRTIGPGAQIVQDIKPLKVLQAVRRDNIVAAEPVDVPMNIYTYEDYQYLSAKETLGTPLHVLYQPQGYVGRLTLWQRPNTYWQTNGQLYIRYHRPFQDFDVSGDEPDFPVEWHEALIYSLACRVAPNYGVPINEREMLQRETKVIMDDVLGFGTEEGSLYLMPERRW